MLNIQFHSIWFTVHYEWEAGCEDTLDTPGTGERIYITSIMHGDTNFHDFMIDACLLDELEKKLISKIQ